MVYFIIQSLMSPLEFVQASPSSFKVGKGVISPKYSFIIVVMLEEFDKILVYLIYSKTSVQNFEFLDEIIVL